eukprot:COSAG01_NODE_5367_length_4305_cov_60.283642_5_plen_123_part_00
MSATAGCLCSRARRRRASSSARLAYIGTRGLTNGGACSATTTNDDDDDDDATGELWGSLSLRLEELVDLAESESLISERTILAARRRQEAVVAQQLGRVAQMQALLRVLEDDSTAKIYRARG